MGNVWRMVSTICGILLIVGLALIAVGYATGSSLERLAATSDILVMSKFVDPQILRSILTAVLGA